MGIVQDVLIKHIIKPIINNRDEKCHNLEKTGICYNWRESFSKFHEISSIYVWILFKPQALQLTDMKILQCILPCELPASQKSLNHHHKESVPVGNNSNVCCVSLEFCHFMVNVVLTAFPCLNAQPEWLTYPLEFIKSKVMRVLQISLQDIL